MNLESLGKLLDDPRTFAGELGGALANKSDDEWQRIMHAAPIPCGVVNCDCHIFIGGMFTALDAARDYAREKTASLTVVPIFIMSSKPKEGA